jgi:hypothetical protein
MSEIWQIVKKSIRQSYDYLGLVLAGSLAWFALTSIPFYFVLLGFPGLGGRSGVNLLPIVAGLILAVLFAGPITAGVFVVAKQIVRDEAPSPNELISGYTHYLVPSMGLFALDVLLAMIFGADILFFLRMVGTYSGVLRYVFLFFLVIAVYAGGFWLASGLYHWPLLVEQGGDVLKVQKKSILLAFDNTAYTFGFAFAVSVITLILLFSRFGAAVLLMGLISILEYNAILPLLQKYGLEPDDQVSED